MKAQEIKNNEVIITLVGQRMGIRVVRFGKPYSLKNTGTGFYWVEVNG